MNDPIAFPPTELGELQRQLRLELPSLLGGAGFNTAAIELWRRGIPYTEAEADTWRPLLKVIQKTAADKAARLHCPLPRAPAMLYPFRDKDTTARYAWQLVGTADDPWGLVWRCQAIARACRAIIAITRKNVEVLYG